MKLYEHVYTRGAGGYGTVSMCNKLTEQTCDAFNRKYTAYFDDTRRQLFALMTVLVGNERYLLFTSAVYADKPSAVESRPHLYVDSFVVPSESQKEFLENMINNPCSYFLNADFSTSYNVDMDKLPPELTLFPELESSDNDCAGELHTSRYAIYKLLESILNGIGASVPIEYQNGEDSRCANRIMYSLYKHAGWLMDFDSPWTYCTSGSHYNTDNSDFRIVFYDCSRYSAMKLRLNQSNKVLIPYDDERNESLNSFLWEVAGGVLEQKSIAGIDIMKEALSLGIISKAAPNIAQYDELYSFFLKLIDTDGLTVETFTQLCSSLKLTACDESFLKKLLLLKPLSKIHETIRTAIREGSKRSWTPNSPDATEIALEYCKNYADDRKDNTVIAMYEYLLGNDSFSTELAEKYINYRLNICKNGGCDSITSLSASFVLPKSLYSYAIKTILDNTSPILAYVMSILHSKPFDLAIAEALAADSPYSLCAYKALLSNKIDIDLLLATYASFVKKFTMANIGVIEHEMRNQLTAALNADISPKAALKISQALHESIFADECSKRITTIINELLHNAYNAESLHNAVILAHICDEYYPCNQVIQCKKAIDEVCDIHIIMGIRNRLLKFCTEDTMLLASITDALANYAKELTARINQDLNTAISEMSDEAAVKYIILTAECDERAAGVLWSVLNRMYSPASPEKCYAFVYSIFDQAEAASNSIWQNRLERDFSDIIGKPLRDCIMEFGTVSGILSVFVSQLDRVQHYNLPKVFSRSSEDIFKQVFDETEFVKSLTEMLNKAIAPLLLSENISQFVKRSEAIFKTYSDLHSSLAIYGLDTEPIFVNVIKNNFANKKPLQTLYDNAITSILRTDINDNTQLERSAVDIANLYASCDTISECTLSVLDARSVLLSSVDSIVTDKLCIAKLFFGEKPTEFISDAVDTAVESVRYARKDNVLPNTEGASAKSANALIRSTVAEISQMLQAQLHNALADDSAMSRLIEQVYEKYIDSYEKLHNTVKENGDLISLRRYQLKLYYMVNDTLLENFCGCRDMLQTDSFIAMLSTILSYNEQHKTTDSNLRELYYNVPTAVALYDFYAGLLELCEYGKALCDHSDKSLAKLKKLWKQLNSNGIISDTMYKKLTGNPTKLFGKS